MNKEVWSAVDRYVVDMLLPKDDALEAALADSASAGLPSIAVSPAQGKLLHLLARMCNAKRILEIGTLGGYSTIWLARALPADGKLITLEYAEKHAQVAQKNIARAGLADKVQIRVGKAIDSLPKLEQENAGPFDLIFIDADKPSNADYFAWAVKLSRVGTTIVVDNVVRDGKVADANSADENVRGVRKFYEAMASEKRVSATVIQTVGSKGYDGLAVAVVER